MTFAVAGLAALAAPARAQNVPLDDLPRRIAAIAASGDADQAAAMLETELPQNPRIARALLAAFCDGILRSAAGSIDPTTRAIAVPGLRFLDGGDALLKQLTEDRDPAVRRALEAERARKAPRGSKGATGIEKTARAPREGAARAAGSRQELVERLLSPLTELERVEGAAQFFAAGLGEPPR